MLRRLRAVLLQSIVRLFDDEALQLAAALAYYSLLSMAPLLLVVISLAGIFFTDGEIHTALVEQMRALVGNEGAALTRTVIDNAQAEGSGGASLLVGGVLILVGATTVFAQLQHALNKVWRVAAAPGRGLIVEFVKQRLLSFALVLSVGFLLMVSLVISAVLAAVQTYVDDWLDGVTLFWQVVDLAVSFGIATTLIALMFKYLPDANIAWRDTWLGAGITALLFIVGKQLIGLYLGQTTIASSYGAAGSVVVFMVWVYYASLILLFGAEVTQAVADQRGAKVVPMEHATRAAGPATTRDP
jgi:membrane protein